MDKQSLYKNLEVILEDIVKVYRALLETVRREKDLLIESKMQDLHDSNNSKEMLILKLKELDLLRLNAASELARVVGANVETPRLQEIALKLQDPQSTKLRSIHATLEILLGRIQEFNDSNAMLVGNALRTLDGALGIIRDSVQTPQQKVYGQTGEVKKPDASSGHFVSKQV